jgi:hypothetical protein
VNVEFGSTTTIVAALNGPTTPVGGKSMRLVMTVGDVLVNVADGPQKLTRLRSWRKQVLAVIRDPDLCTAKSTKTRFKSDAFQESLVPPAREWLPIAREQTAVTGPKRSCPCVFTSPPTGGGLLNGTLGVHAEPSITSLRNWAMAADWNAAIEASANATKRQIARMPDLLLKGTAYATRIIAYPCVWYISILSV